MTRLLAAHRGGYNADMGLAQPKQRLTPEQYLRRERDSLDKHEFYRGEVFAMAGGSAEHSRVTANAIRRIGDRLDGSPCGVFDSNLRIRVPGNSLYTYPDLSVICGPLEYDPLDRGRETVLNPTLLVEVLSPSTEAYDRGAKFENYQQIVSLREYLLLSQSVARAETFLRQPDNTWLYTAVTGLETSVRLASLRIEVPLAELYAGTTFPPGTTAPSV
jgi:Uma2 family endonuclease